VVESEQCNNIYDDSLNILHVSSYIFFMLFFLTPTPYDILLNNPLNLDVSLFQSDLYQHNCTAYNTYVSVIHISYYIKLSHGNMFHLY